MSEASNRRVVVTGMGVVSGLGIGAEAFWQSLVSGQSGISAVTRFDASAFRSQVGGQADNFDPTEFVDSKEANRNDRYVLMALAASRMAVEQAKLGSEDYDPSRFGVIIGTGVGGMESIEKHSRVLFERGPAKMSPFTITNIIGNMASGCVAIDLNARAPNYAIVSACASGGNSIGEAMMTIQRGAADMMVCGGTEAAITPLSYGGFCAMRAMSSSFNDTPEKASRPFDRQRDGFVMGEGSGVLVIETEAHARARGAPILCELAGYGASCDAYHMTSPDTEGKGLISSIEQAFTMADLPLDTCDYINAHGTSTQYNDKYETYAIKKSFGNHAYDLAMSSTKSMTGHLLGAAGGVEAVAAICSIRDHLIPPTINLEEPDPDLDLNYVPGQSEKREVKVSLSNNLGFGGHNASLLFKAYT